MLSALTSTTASEIEAGPVNGNCGSTWCMWYCAPPPTVVLCPPPPTMVLCPPPHSGIVPPPPHSSRALCRIKLLLVTHVLVDTWMLTVKPLYKLSNVPEMVYKHTYDTIYNYIHFPGITNNIYDFGSPFLLLHFLTRPPIFLPVHIRSA